MRVGESRDSRSRFARLTLLVPRHVLSINVLRPLAASLIWSILIASALQTRKLPSWQCQAAERTLAGLSSVTGLLLAFRSNSATSRWEGASKAWGGITATLRSLLRLLSTSLLQDCYADGVEPRIEDRVHDMLQLVPCFALATMLQLQGKAVDLKLDCNGAFEKGSTDPLSVRTLLALLPDPYLNLFKAQETLSSKKRRQRRRRPSLSSASPSRLPTGTGVHSSAQANRTSTFDPAVSSEAEREIMLSQNIDASRELLCRARPRVDTSGRITPQELALDLLRVLQAELNAFHRGVTAAGLHLSTEGTAAGGPSSDLSSSGEFRLAGPIFAHCTGLLNTLNMQVTELERLRDTPMPALVSSHLRFLLHLQLVLLPMALAGHLPPLWLPLPCLFITAASFGLHSLSERLALPFGEEREKLPMRRYVAELIRDWRETLGRTGDVFDVLAKPSSLASASVSTSTMPNISSRPSQLRRRG